MERHAETMDPITTQPANADAAGRATLPAPADVDCAASVSCGLAPASAAAAAAIRLGGDDYISDQPVESLSSAQLESARSRLLSLLSHVESAMRSRTAQPAE